MALKLQAEQGHRYHEEGEVVPDGRREDADERDLQQQGRGRDQEDPSRDPRWRARRFDTVIDFLTRDYLWWSYDHL